MGLSFIKYADEKSIDPIMSLTDYKWLNLEVHKIIAVYANKIWVIELTDNVYIIYSEPKTQIS